MIPIFLACIAAIAAIGGAVWQEREKTKSDKLAEDNQKKADKFQEDARNNQAKADEYFNKLIAAGEENARLNIEINSKTEDIIKSNNELIKFQGETIKNLMGSGYAWLGIFVKNEDLHFYIQSKSLYPMYDLMVAITDYKKITEKYPIDTKVQEVTINEDFYDKCTVLVTKAEINLKAKAYINFSQFVKPNNGTYFFLTKIKAKHGTIGQFSIVECLPKLNAIRHSYKIFEYLPDNNMKLIEDHSNGLPESMWINNFHYKKRMKFTTAELEM